MEKKKWGKKYKIMMKIVASMSLPAGRLTGTLPTRANNLQVPLKHNDVTMMVIKGRKTVLPL